MKLWTLATVLAGVGATLVQAQTATKPPASDSAQAAQPSDVERRHQQFASRMSNVRLIGQFTVIGKKEDGPLAKEEYTIRKVEKLPEGDKWSFLCRIKYGQHDVVVPLPIDVKWAGETPVLTLDDLSIPGLGTFSSRVVIHDDKYAGTWRHDNVGGHLFGIIEKVAAEPADKPSK